MRIRGLRDAVLPLSALLLAVAVSAQDEETPAVGVNWAAVPDQSCLDLTVPYETDQEVTSSVQANYHVWLKAQGYVPIDSPAADLALLCDGGAYDAFVSGDRENMWLAYRPEDGAYLSHEIGFTLVRFPFAERGRVYVDKDHDLDGVVDMHYVLSGFEAKSDFHEADMDCLQHDTHQTLGNAFAEGNFGYLSHPDVVGSLEAQVTYSQRLTVVDTRAQKHVPAGLLSFGEREEKPFNLYCL